MLRNTWGNYLTSVLRVNVIPPKVLIVKNLKEIKKELSKILGLHFEVHGVWLLPKLMFPNAWSIYCQDQLSKSLKLHHETRYWCSSLQIWHHGWSGFYRYQYVPLVLRLWSAIISADWLLQLVFTSAQMTMIPLENVLDNCIKSIVSLTKSTFLAAKLLLKYYIVVVLMVSNVESTQEPLHQGSHSRFQMHQSITSCWETCWSSPLIQFGHMKIQGTWRRNGYKREMVSHGQNLQEATWAIKGEKHYCLRHAEFFC